ncbi:centrosomal protein of 89 kDa [Anabrus simplex]|uniref:centrosomal protein of 89 kDa n=1 Tax=Anabrus simplex TaxID=316456 RepID=UPI0034DDC52E
MPPPVFTAVPTLPMFLVESSRKPSDILTLRTGSQLDEPSTSHTLSVPNTLEGDVLRRPRRKPGRRKYSSSSHSRERRGEEVLVHNSHSHRRHHHHHKTRHRIKLPPETELEEGMEGDVPEENTAEGEQSSSDLLNTSPRPSIDQQNGIILEQTNVTPEGCELLLREVERLKKVNRDLTRRLQASLSSLDSGYQQTVVDETVKQKEEEIVNLQRKIQNLDKSLKDLERQRNHLMSLLEERSTKQEDQQIHNPDYDRLVVQNQELREDVSMLKNLVYRLNVELENYQERFHKLGKSDSLPPKENLSSKYLQGKDGTLAWNKINKETLGPLLEAYSETIKEKDELIQDYERNSSKYVARCKEVVAENERLYQELEDQRKKFDATEAELKILKQDSALTQEQNELLSSQLEVQKDKLKEVHSAYQQKVTDLTKDLEEVYNKYHSCRGELLTYQGRYSVLREEYDKLRNDNEKKVPFSVHSASVTECRRLFEELKLKYEGDKHILSSKIQALEIEKPQLEGQLSNMESEKQQLQAHIRSLEKLLKKAQLKTEDLQGRLVTTQVSRDTTKRQLQKAMAFAEELVAEQENLLRQLHAKQEETKSIAKLGSTIVYRMGSLKSKLKNVQQGAWQELDVIEKRIRQQESGVERMKDEYHQEVMRLRNLVRQKEAIIGRLQKEKSKTEDNLEVVWRAATSEDIHIKESLKQVNFSPEKKETIRFLNESDTSNAIE